MANIQTGYYYLSGGAGDLKAVTADVVPKAGYFKEGYPLCKDTGAYLVAGSDFTYDLRLDSTSGGGVDIYDDGASGALGAGKYIRLIDPSTGLNIKDGGGLAYTQIVAKTAAQIDAGSPAAGIVWVDPATSRYKGIGGATIHEYLHSYWKMDAGSGANEPNEIQASGYDLTNVGTVPSAAGKLGTARGAYSGTNRFTGAGQGIVSVYDTKTFIVEAWVKLDLNNEWNYIVGKTDIGSSLESNGGWLLWVGYNYGKATFWVYGMTPIVSSNRIDDGNWHYLVGGVRAQSGVNEIRLYVDGVLNSQTSGVYWTICDQTPPLVVGARINGWYPFQGLIDDVAYWNTVPADWATIEAIIVQRYNGGAGAEYGAGNIKAGYYYLAEGTSPYYIKDADASGTYAKIIV